MKKIIFIPLTIIVGFVGYLAYSIVIDNTDHNVGLVKSYTDYESIESDAELVVRAHLDKNYTIVETPAKQAVREIKIKKIFKNETENSIEKGDTISLYEIIAFYDVQEKQYINIKKEEEINIKEGEYLLFLNSVEHDGKTYYVNNSKHHLYKWRGKNTFENVRSDMLETIEIENE